MLDAMRRPQRLMLKRAYAKTQRHPLMMDGPNMARVAQEMVRLGYLKQCRAGYVLTGAGFKLAFALRVDGWPNCEKGRG